MHSFTYHRPGDLAEAVALLAASPDGRPLAGGMSLLPVMKQRLAQPPEIVDLGRIPALDRIEAAPGLLTIGAMARHGAVAADPVVRATIPALAALAGGIGDPQVRNRGTLGGSVANADPAADYPAALLALGATIRTDRRSLAADDFFLGLFETALEPGELIVEIAFPVPQAAAYVKLPQPASRFAIVGVFVARGADGVRVGVTGAGPCAFRPADIEQALNERFDPAALDGIRISPDGLNSDIHADAQYRAHLVRVLAQRAVRQAAGQA